MSLWLTVLSLVFLVLLVLVRALRPAPPTLSEFELARRVKLRNEMALEEQRREQAVPMVRTLRRIASVVLLLGLLWSLTMVIGVGWSAAIVIILVLASGLLEGEPHRYITRLYRRIEPGLLKVVESRVVRVLPVAKSKRHDSTIHSTDELTHTLAHASFLDSRERELIAAALDFPRLTARDVMRPVSALKSIDKGEVLGPLVIDDLYKTGESVFLVTDGDINHVVGLLPLDKLTGLELMGSPNALKAMDDTVETIGEAEPIAEALERLRDSETLLLIVQDSEARTVGALSLGDIIDRLFAEQ